MISQRYFILRYFLIFLCYILVNEIEILKSFIYFCNLHPLAYLATMCYLLKKMFLSNSFQIETFNVALLSIEIIASTSALTTSVLVFGWRPNFLSTYGLGFGRSQKSTSSRPLGRTLSLLVSWQFWIKPYYKAKENQMRIFICDEKNLFTHLIRYAITFHNWYHTNANYFIVYKQCILEI